MAIMVYLSVLMEYLWRYMKTSVNCFIIRKAPLLSTARYVSRDPAETLRLTFTADRKPRSLRSRRLVRAGEERTSLIHSPARTKRLLRRVVNSELQIPFEGRFYKSWTAQ